MNKVYLLLKNIKYLCTHNVREEILNSQYDTLLSVEVLYVKYKKI